MQQSSGAGCQKIHQSPLSDKHLQLSRKSCLWTVVERDRKMDQCVSTNLKKIAFWKGLQAPEKQDMAINNMVTYLRQVPAFSAQGLLHCFSALPGYFCHDILGKEKFLLLFLLFYFTPVREVGLGQLHCSAVLSTRGPRKETRWGHLPPAPAGHCQPLLWWDMLDLPALPSQIMATGQLPVAREPPSVIGDDLGGLHNCKETRLSRKHLSLSVQIEKIFDGLKSVSSLYACRVSLSGCWGWGTLPTWGTLNNWSVFLTETQVPGAVEDH